MQSNGLLIIQVNSTCFG